MMRLVFIAALTVPLWACSDGGPTGADPAAAPSRGSSASLQTLDSATSSEALFECSQLEEVRVRFSDPGYLDHLKVGLYVSYIGVPPGNHRLRVWWDYANSFDLFQEIRIDEADLERIGGRNVYGKVIEHVYDPVSVATPRQVRAELILEGTPGGCSRNRDIVVQPAGPVLEDDADPPCGGEACKVFVTSTRYDGNLGGLDGADALCQSSARTAGLSGQYKAWLSDPSESPLTRFRHAPTAYVLLDGTVLAPNWSALVSSPIQHHIDLTELGTRASGISTVWTRTFSNGSPASFGLGPDCEAWTSSSATGFGTNGEYEGKLELWSFIGASSCNARLRLYCFQQ